MDRLQFFLHILFFAVGSPSKCSSQHMQLRPVSFKLNVPVHAPKKLAY